MSKNKFHIRRFPTNPLFPETRGKFYWGASGFGGDNTFTFVEDAFADILRETISLNLADFPRR